jgi:FKBP-type peptidyl-prolyl cis-trans isomerase FkpA/FKBP-type peptidyl-prolyl cis-trans isomerase FklB
MSEIRNKAKQKEAEENKKKGEQFLAENAKKEGFKVTKSGLQYNEVKKGTGPSPKPDDIVKVHYKGMLINGKEFDSSYKRNKPAEFPVKAVIPGWTEALQLMKVGSKFQLVIPPELAYGSRGNPSIPGNSVLIFDVELLDIKKGKSKKKK